MINNLKSTLKAAFIFQLQPLDKIYPCLIIHVIPWNTGKANPKIVQKLDELKKIIEKNSNFAIIGYAADGDNSYRHFLRNLAFNGIRKSDDVLFFSDYLHLMKRGRYWFLKNIDKIATNVNQFISDFCVQYNIPSIVMSNEKITKMHDSLPIRLFDLKVLLKSVIEGHNLIFSYIFPWSLFMTLINSKNISMEKRYKYLLIELFQLVPTTL